MIHSSSNKQLCQYHSNAHQHITLAARDFGSTYTTPWDRRQVFELPETKLNLKTGSFLTETGYESIAKLRIQSLPKWLLTTDHLCPEFEKDF
jgi:hypothetical protein